MVGWGGGSDPFCGLCGFARHGASFLWLCPLPVLRTGPSPLATQFMWFTLSFSGTRPVQPSLWTPAVPWRAFCHWETPECKKLPNRGHRRPRTLEICGVSSRNSKPESERAPHRVTGEGGKLYVFFALCCGLRFVHRVEWISTCALVCLDLGGFLEGVLP
jgi:hypothetical protein